MSKIDIVKESLQFQPLIKKDSSITNLKDEYLIPDTHPDVDEILMIEALPQITEKDISGSKINIEGKVEYNIIYIPRDDGMMLNSVKYFEKFSSFLDIGEDEHKVICEADCKLEHIQSRVMNERKIDIESSIKINVQVYKEVEFEVVKDIESTGGVQILRDSAHINRIVADKDVELISKSMIRVGMDKPQINKILNYSAMVHKKEVKMGEDKVYLACYCKLNILYIGGEENQVICLEDDVYISKEEELQGVMTDMLSSITYEIADVDLSIEEDDLGEARIINTEFLVNGKLKVYSDENIDLIEDAYSTKFSVELMKENHKIGLVHSIKSMESTIKDNLYIKEGDLKPEFIQNICSNVVMQNTNIADEKINIEGIINVSVLYRTTSEEKAYGVLSGEIPYTITLDVNGINSNMKTIVCCDLDSIEAAIEANTIAIKATIIANAKVTYDVNKEFISEIIDGDGEVSNKNSSITIYVIGKDESLWNLAKKFNTTVDDLIKINDIEDPDSIIEGEKLIIPGRACF